jgi:high frequency lysogenization protein
MQHSKREQTIALAGVFQAASLVQQIANKGMANSAVIESSLETLFRFDSDTVEGVFGNIAGVGTGLRVLNEQLSAFKNKRNLEVTQYVISLLVLEKKLSSNSKMLDHITKTLAEVETSLEFFSLMHENIFAKLGALYKETISTLEPKIIVHGEQTHLSNESNANKVRALLLAGIRSAVLWRQCNGSRWQILFGRKSYLNEAKIMLAEL